MKKENRVKVYAVQTFKKVNDVHILLYQAIRESKKLAEIEKACQQRVFDDCYTTIEIYEIRLNKLNRVEE